MADREHHYVTHVRWTGNLGDGTAGYRSYSRSHEIIAAEKPPIPGSSDPSFRGDPARYNPEELLVASLSACHMLWYLHLCADAGIVVVQYEDDASGRMVESADSGGRFEEVVLRPAVVIRRGGDESVAQELHERAHRMCFIANSVNFTVRTEATVRTSEPLP